MRNSVISFTLLEYLALSMSTATLPGDRYSIVAVFHDLYQYMLNLQYILRYVEFESIKCLKCFRIDLSLKMPHKQKYEEITMP